ncbi:hypothetical protein ACE6H2_017155 [Prunus campanulata]
MCLLPQSFAPISYHLAVQQAGSTIETCHEAQRSCLNEAAVVVISPAPIGCLPTPFSFGCTGREEEEEKGKRKLHYEKVAFTLPILLTCSSHD